MPSNIYRKTGGRIWYFRASVAGSEHRRSLRTTNRQTAEKRAQQLLEELRRRSWGDQRYTWVQAVEAWVGDVGESLKPQTIRRYGTSVAALAHILEPLFLDEIDKRVLAQIATRAGVTNATRKRDLTAVSVILNACEARGWIEAVPAYSRRRLKERTAPLILPTAAQVDRLVSHLSPMLGRLVRLLERTGMRLEEAGGLQWGDVDLRRKTITLTETKAGRVRVIPLTDAALGTLSGTPRHIGCPYVFWVGQDKPHRYGDLSGLLYDLRKAAGVKWRIHDLRHLYAVRYLQNGGKLRDLQKILGHGSIAVTERYLDHLTPEEQTGS